MNPYSLVRKGETTNSFQLFKEFDYIVNANYVKKDDKWHLVVWCYKGWQIWNENGSRLQEKIEAPESPDSTPYAFTCSSRAKSDRGIEYIAIGSNKGEIFFMRDKGKTQSVFTMHDSNPITHMTFDDRSKVLAVGNSNGYVVLFNAEEVEGSVKLNPISHLAPPNEIPLTSLGTLFRGENLLVGSFSNGTVIIYTFTGEKMWEIGAHSRNINAVCWHPSKSIFVTVGDDWFLNVWEVAGDTTDKIDVDLRLSSKITDLMLVGVQFAGEDNSSIVAVPYDYPNLILCENVI
jgi:WD40 repeat protein